MNADPCYTNYRQKIRWYLPHKLGLFACLPLRAEIVLNLATFSSLIKVLFYIHFEN